MAETTAAAALVDVLTVKYEVQPVPDNLVIRTAEEFVAVAEAQIADKELRAKIVSDFAESKKAAHEAHKKICEQEKRHLSETDARIAIRDVALIAFDDERRRIADEQARLISHVAAEEQQERVLDEAVELQQQAIEQGRPELAERARELMENPPPAPVATVPVDTPKVSGLSIPNRKIVSTCVDKDAFLIALMKPRIYAYMAAALLAKADDPANKKDAAAIRRVAAFLDRGSKELPALDLACVEVSDSWLTKTSNNNKKPLQFPGVANTTKGSTRRS